MSIRPPNIWKTGGEPLGYMLRFWCICDISPQVPLHETLKNEVLEFRHMVHPYEKHMETIWFLISEPFPDCQLHHWSRPFRDLLYACVAAVGVYWSKYIKLDVAPCINSSIYIYMSPVPGPPHPPPPPQWYPPPTPNPPHPPQNLVFACYLHIYIHIYTYILPFPPLQPRTSTLFAVLESHDLVNGPCLPVYFYHNLFFEPPIACLAHGLQHICYLWITQSLPMQT